MRRSIIERCPTKIDIGAVYNIEPKDSRKLKLLSLQPIERELVFDIDMTDYDDVRLCCKGADICDRCWPFMIVAARILEAILREDFGFKNILWVYSGRRGIHCWVVDERARCLKSDARDAIANFINIFDGGQFKAKKVQIDGFKGLHPSINRSIKIIDNYFEELMINKQNFLETPTQIETIANLFIDNKLRNDIKKTLTNDCNLKTTNDRWKMIQELCQKFYVTKPNHYLNRSMHRHRYALDEIKLQLCYPRLDINVTRGLNHLLKVPFSVHPKTGRVCVPIDFGKIDQFDPFTVPTIEDLCAELDKISVENNSATLDGQECSNAGKIAYKTSLASALNLFRNFIQNMEQCLHSTKLTNNDEKLNF